MPSPTDRSLCIYGDSQLACIKAALNQGLIDTSGFAIEFWGGGGPWFRDLRWRNGRIRPTTDDSRLILNTVNRRGRDSLGAEDFDDFLFVGARLRASEFLIPALRGRGGGAGFLSRAVIERLLDNWLASNRSYRFARSFAESGRARVLFAPAPLPCDTILDPAEVAATVNQLADAGDRAELWEMVARAMAADGIELVAQPDETVTRGCLTRADFAADGAREAGDAAHMNGAYGALILTRALDRLRDGRRRQAA